MRLFLVLSLLFMFAQQPAWAGDVAADIESLEACVLESGASGHERDCIGILHQICETPRCFQLEMALWRLILLEASPSEPPATNRRMQVGDWSDRVELFKQQCSNASNLPDLILRKAACERDAYAHAAMDALLAE
ncbi:MAG: hypothetical protein AAF479_10155 [Pseudomonadota bacterium]